MSEPNNPTDENMTRALSSIREMLSQLEAGELFCMDRGYAWTLESEGDRRKLIVDRFHELPALRQRLPLMWSYIEANQTIANRGNTLIEEIDRPPG